MHQQPTRRSLINRRARAYAVHVLTASGVVLAFLAAAEIASPQTDARLVFLFLAIAVLIDAADGPLARRADVKRYAPAIAGRTIDDLVDYLTFTFLPLLLVWRMDWLAGPEIVLVPLAMLLSLFGFANVGAKEEDNGFFLGFPSYWNLFAFYAGIWAFYGASAITTLLLLTFAATTVLPVRFLYPNLAPRRVKPLIMWGGAIWAATLIPMGLLYPAVPHWLHHASLIYPILYLLVSMTLDLKDRQRRGRPRRKQRPRRPPVPPGQRP